MLQAKDIMEKDVISVKEDMPIYDAIELLRENHITGLPVVEDDMTLIGILSEKDVISMLYYAHGDEEEKVVADFMTENPTCFNEDETLLNICDSLIVHSFRRVPITSQEKLIGLISRADLIDCILHLRDENTVTSSEKKD
ncbi:MAG TPA: CBS domain-containing protein [bacterium]|nr:CBS domain-containing protein [bacterium]